MSSAFGRYAIALAPGMRSQGPGTVKDMDEEEEPPPPPPTVVVVLRRRYHCTLSGGGCAP